MRRWMGTVSVSLAACLLVTASLGLGLGVATASANEAPLAEAGLDQSVRTNATVYLDAGGSLDPDGDIESYHWRIERPNGTATAPACDSCVTTEFVPRQVGTYEVTVTVTDDDNATASDTLYVEVRDRDPPEVELSGPGSLVAGSTGSFEATATDGEADVSSVAWYLNGSGIDSQFVDGADTWRHNVTFEDPGTHTVEVAVTDALGQQTRQSHEVSVVAVPSNGSRPSGVSSGSSGSSGGGLAGSSLGSGYVSYAPGGDSLLFSGIDDLYLSDPGADSLALSPSDVESGLERVSEQNIQRSCDIGTVGDCAGQRDVTVSGEAADVLADQLDINPSGLRTSFTGGGIDTQELEQELGSGAAENGGERNSGGDTTGRYNNPDTNSNGGGESSDIWTTDTPSVDWSVDEDSDSGSSDSSSSNSGSDWSTDSPATNWDIDGTSDSNSNDSGGGGNGSNSDSGSSESNSDSSSDSGGNDGGGGCNFNWYC